eukprot:15446655-Alexandrium_andersonii.AAC.1
MMRRRWRKRTTSDSAARVDDPPRHLPPLQEVHLSAHDGTQVPRQLAPPQARCLERGLGAPQEVCLLYTSPSPRD